MALQDDPLGGMFTDDEKKILRSRDPRHKQAKDTLVVRLADAFTFRRAPRSWQFPFFCFDRAALDEEIDISRQSLPPMSKEDVRKADKVMEFVGTRMGRHRIEIPSGLTTADLEYVLHVSRIRWVNDGKDRDLFKIIDSIPNKTQINKVVCIGLSEIAQSADPAGDFIDIIPYCLAQHLAAWSMTSYLRDLVSHEVKLFAADWIYDIPHRIALESFGFTILDGSYGKQEQFVAIDDNTMLISFAIPGFESILPIISEYARPVAMLYDAYDHLVKKNHPPPPLSPVWSRVKYDDTWVTIPGPPVVTTDHLTEPAAEDLLAPLARWFPFYTKSTQLMLDDYKIAVNMSEFDVSRLASRFELDPRLGKEPVDSDKMKERRFFLRK
ncbi:hypothetical protein ONZ43_g4422 [Nemania bipapillata]|uniref:Uncharacterized protein n=1 Tax=Nemania bipapillata TaxID=110536 RepID=A0ACC2IMU5_9PEZI|nr:hypothetical protein ONZ43_g4422 [Nemania bipapillata]